MSERVVRKLDFSRKFLQLTAGCMAVAVLVVIWVLNATASQAQSQTAARSPTEAGARMQIEVASAKQEKATDGMATALAKSKAWTFEVVSIRPSKPDGGTQQIGPTPDGYRMRNLFLMFPILTAYVPLAGGAAFDGGSEGFPDWVVNDPYDIDAKVSEGDLANWQNPALQAEMLRSMLQSTLADRLKLVVHRSMKETAVYSLIVGKNGPKFKETNPSEPHPGFTLPGGAIASTELQDGERISHYYRISMPMVATFLFGNAGRTVQDNTGLTGLYDITMRSPAPVRTLQGEQPQNAAPPDSGPSVFTKAEELGLKLVPEKGQVETLVIDHVERPSEN